METATALFLGFIVVQRLGELVLARANTAQLLARGGHEVGADHYPFMVTMHASWIACLVIFGHDQVISLFWLTPFILLQILRGWILATLGRRWTTRVIILNEPLVTRGPFSYLRHPNYTLVAAEVIVIPMVLGLVYVAAIFTVLNAAMLWVRIGVEDKALAAMRTDR